MKKIVFILSVFCIVATAMYAQSESLIIKERVAVPKSSFVFNLGYNFPSISNALINSNWDKNMGTGMEFGVDYRKQFRTTAMEDDDIVLTPTWFAMGVGLGISYFSQSATFNKGSHEFDYKDRDEDPCTVNLTFPETPKESVSLTYLDVPLYLEIGKPSRVKTSAYLKLGVKASLLVSDKFSGTGTYTSTGDYAAPFYVNLYDIKELGYTSDPQPCYNNIKPELSPFVIWGSISAGVNIPLNNLEKNKLASWIFRIGAKIDYSLTPISKASKDSDLELASQPLNGVSRFTDPYPFNQSNMLGGDGSKIFSFGLSLGMIYCF